MPNKSESEDADGIEPRRIKPYKVDYVNGRGRGKSDSYRGSYYKGHYYD